MTLDIINKKNTLDTHSSKTVHATKLKRSQRKELSAEKTQANCRKAAHVCDSKLYGKHILVALKIGAFFSFLIKLKSTNIERREHGTNR